MAAARAVLPAAARGRLVHANVRKARDKGTALAARMAAVRTRALRCQQLYHTSTNVWARIYRQRTARQNASSTARLNAPFSSTSR